MNSDARERLLRFSQLKNEIDEAYSSIANSELPDALSPAPPSLCIFSNEQLDLALQAHNQHSDRVDQLNVGDLDRLRELAKAASDREMHEADTDLVELTLETLFAFDKLRNLLRQRAVMLNLHSLRLQWEAQRSSVLEEETSLRHDMLNFIQKSRWYMPSDMATPKKRLSSSGSFNSRSPAKHQKQRLVSSGSNSNLMARRMRSDIFSLDIARFSQRLHSLMHVAIKASGKHLDKIIDTSPVQIPDPFLDLQEADEDRATNLNKGTIAFLQALSKQWKAADEIAYAALDVRATSESTQREAESEILKSPCESSLKHYQLLLGHHTATLATLKAHIHDPAILPQPVHIIAPDQSEHTQQLICTLEYLTDKSQKALELGKKAVERYDTAFQVLNQALNHKADLNASLATLQDLSRSCTTQMRALHPDMEAQTPEEIRLIQLQSALSAELATSEEKRGVARQSLDKMREAGIDPNVSREMHSLLDCYNGESHKARNLQQIVHTQLEHLQTSRATNSKFNALENSLKSALHKEIQNVRQSLWGEGWQRAELLQLDISASEVQQVKEDLESVATFAQDQGWDVLLQATNLCHQTINRINGDLKGLSSLKCAALQQLQQVEEVLQQTLLLEQKIEKQIGGPDVLPTSHLSLEHDIEELLESLHQKTPFIAGPKLPVDLDLVAHDARVRGAVNKAAMQLNSSFESLKRMVKESHLKTQLEEMRGVLIEVQNQVQMVSGRIHDHHESPLERRFSAQEINSALEQLPTESDFQVPRRQVADLIEKSIQLQSASKGTEALHPTFFEFESELQNELQCINDLEETNRVAYESLLREMSENETRQAEERRKQLEEEAAGKQAQSRYESWRAEIRRVEDDATALLEQLSEPNPCHDTAIGDGALQQAQEAVRVKLSESIKSANLVASLQRELQSLQQQCLQESRWPETASTDVQAVLTHLQDLEARQAAYVATLEAQSESLTARAAKLQESVKRQAIQNIIDEATAGFNAPWEATQDALNSLRTALQKMPPLSDDTKEGKKSLGALDEALKGAQSAVQLLHKAHLSAMALLSNNHRDSAETARKLMAEKTSEAHIQFKELSASARSARDTWMQHIEDSQRQRQALKLTATRSATDQTSGRSNELQLQESRSVLEQHIQTFQKTVQSLEEGIKHVQKQRATKNQTAVLSRSLSSSTHSLRGLSQSLLEDQSQLQRRLFRTLLHSGNKDGDKDQLEIAVIRIEERFQAAQKELTNLENHLPKAANERFVDASIEHAASSARISAHDDVFTSREEPIQEKAHRLYDRSLHFADVKQAIERVHKRPAGTVDLLHLHDLQRQVEDLQQSSTTNGFDKADSQELNEVATSLGVQEKLAKFSMARQNAEQELSDLLDAIDDFVPALPHDENARQPASTAHQSLERCLKQAETSVKRAEEQGHGIQNHVDVSEAIDRLRTTLEELEDLANEKLNPSSNTDGPQQHLLTPKTVSGSSCELKSPSSRVSLFPSANRSSRIPRVSSSMFIRSPTSDIRRASSPSSVNIRSEFARPFSTAAHQTTGGRSYGAIATRRPANPVTPDRRRIPTSSSTSSFRTPERHRIPTSSSSSSLLTPDQRPRKSDGLKPHYSPSSKRAVDQEVARVVNSLNFTQSIPIRSKGGEHHEDKSGRYYIGERLYFCRILRSRCVMIRVGGGWQELRSFLKTHFSHLLAETDADLSALISHSPNTPRSASFPFAKRRTDGGSTEPLKLLSPDLQKREMSPERAWR